MKTFIKSENNELLPALQKVIGVAEAKNTMSILANVLLDKVDNKLRLTCTDTEIQISVSVDDINVDDVESITVNAKKLSTILKSFNNKDLVNLKLSDDNEKMFIHCNKSRFQLQTLPIDDFPNTEFEDNSESQNFIIYILKNDLKRLIKETQFSIAENDIRFYLTGLYLDINPHKITAVATNGNCLAYSTILSETELPTTNAIIPRKAIFELNKLLNDNNNSVAITINKSAIKFEFDNICLISKLVAGKYPDYNGVIRDDWKSGFYINRLDLIKAITQTSIVSNDNNNGVLFEVSPGNLRLTTRNSEHEECEIDLPIEYAGGEISIGFNPKYILNKLHSISEDIVIFRLIDPESTGMISGYSYRNESDDNLATLPIELNGDEADLENFNKTYEKYVVMPMRI